MHSRKKALAVPIITMADGDKKKKLSPSLPHICKTVGGHRAKYLLFTQHVSNAEPPDTIGSPKEGQGCLARCPHHTFTLPVVTMEHSL